MEELLKYILQEQSYDLHQIIPTCPRKENILFHDKLKAEQYWVKPYNLTDFQFMKLSYSEQEEIVEVENERCRNGVWFYNFGEPTFLTGDNYSFLTYYKMEGHIVPDFMKFQTATFYFYLYAELEPSVYATLELKPRREGCTHRKLSIALNRAITHESFFVGIQSKTGKDAKEANFDNVVKAYDKLPCWRKPKVRLEGATRELAFERPPRRSSSKIKSLQDIEYEDYYLNSKIDHRATTTDAYDGDKLHIYILDEFWKHQEANVCDTWDTTKKCLVDGEDIIGIAYIQSTVGIDEKEETVSEEAFEHGLELWKKSDPHERNALGETDSGAIRLFIPAYKSRRGTSRLTKVELLDKYGNVNEEEAKKVLLAKRDGAKDAKAKMVFIRQEPMNVQEAIASFGGSGMTFDNVRLSARLNFLENFEPTPMRPIKYRIGNLAWEKNERFTKVVFNDNSEGRFRIPYFPNIAGEEMVNRIKKTSTNSFIPFSDTPFMLGADPYNFDKTIDGKGSMGAFHIKHKYLNRYCLHYLSRPASIDLFFEDVLMAAWFFGSKINPERSGSPIFDWFKRQGCYGFIVARPDITKNTAFTKSDTEKGTTMTPANMELGCNLTENHFTKPNEENNENVVDNLDYFWDEETLKQLMSFDKKKSSRFDAVMAMFLTEIGCQSMKKFQMTPIKVNENTRASVLDYLIPQFTYTQSGESIATLRANQNGTRNHRQ